MAVSGKKNFFSAVEKPTLSTTARLRRKAFRKHRPVRKPLQTENFLALLHVLNSMKHEHRVVLLEHLSDTVRDRIYKLITHILTSTHIPLRKRVFLKNQLGEDKEATRVFLNPKASSAQRRMTLCRVGGGPMKYMLRAALPVLLDMYK